MAAPEPSAATIAEQIDSLDRREAEIMAAAILREVAKDAIRAGAAGRRNIVTATRESSQLMHLATKLEGYANGD